MAIKIVHIASSRPSGISFPSLSNTAGVDIKCPTFRFSINDRPFKRTLVPAGLVISRSGFKLRVIDFPDFTRSSVRSPFISPNQFL